MVRMFVRHRVNDFEAWRKVYDAFDAERGAMGVTGAAVFRGAEDGSDITAWHDFATLEEAKAFAAWPRLKEAMGEAGVAGEPQIWFVTEA